MNKDDSHQLQATTEALQCVSLSQEVLTIGRSIEKRVQTVEEEIANAISHGFGCAATLVAAPFLVLRTSLHADLRQIVGAGVFGFTIILLYLASTLYHALPYGRTKEIFKIIEHSAIFLLIAGTYTPITLGVLYGPVGWSLFVTIWVLAATGVILKSMGGLRQPDASTLVYLAMGWVILIAIRPLWRHMPRVGFYWILLGGLAYTAGLPFYRAERQYSHLVWHLFVLVGTTCHFMAILP